MTIPAKNPGVVYLDGNPVMIVSLLGPNATPHNSPKVIDGNLREQIILADPLTGAPLDLLSSNAANVESFPVSNETFWVTGTILEAQIGSPIPVTALEASQGVSGWARCAVNPLVVNTNGKTWGVRLNGTLLFTLNANTVWSSGLLKFGFINRGSTAVQSGWAKFLGSDGVSKLATFDSAVETDGDNELTLTLTLASANDVVGVAGKSITYGG